MAVYCTALAITFLQYSKRSEVYFVPLQLPFCSIVNGLKYILYHSLADPLTYIYIYMYRLYHRLTGYTGNILEVVSDNARGRYR